MLDGKPNPDGAAGQKLIAIEGLILTALGIACGLPFTCVC